MAALALVLRLSAASPPLYLYAHGKGPCNVKAPGGACRLSDREIKRLDDIVDAHLHHTITLEDMAQALGAGRCGHPVRNRSGIVRILQDVPAGRGLPYAGAWWQVPIGGTTECATRRRPGRAAGSKHRCKGDNR